MFSDKLVLRNLRGSLCNLESIRYEYFTGEYEPNEDECDWPSDDEESELAEDVKEKVKVRSH